MYNFQTYELKQNNAGKQKVGLCDKTTLQIFFIFTMLDTYVSVIVHAKIQQKISSGPGEEVYFVVFAIFSNTAILVILPDQIL